MNLADLAAVLADVNQLFRRAALASFKYQLHSSHNDMYTINLSNDFSQQVASLANHETILKRFGEYIEVVRVTDGGQENYQTQMFDNMQQALRMVFLHSSLKEPADPSNRRTLMIDFEHTQRLTLSFKNLMTRVQCFSIKMHNITNVTI